VSFLRGERGSRSARFVMRFEVRTMVVRFGAAVERVLDMVEMRFRARRRVVRRGEEGIWEIVVRELSVRSMAS
jgi:hypothetical protein